MFGANECIDAYVLYITQGVFTVIMPMCVV